MADKVWKGNTGGTTWMQRSLITMMEFIPLRIMYVVIDIFVIPFYMLFVHQAYLAMYHFYRQRRGCSMLGAFMNVYRNECKFAQIILDRFYIYSGGKMEFEIDNFELYEQLAKSDEAFVIYSAHIGNYEAAGYKLKANNKRYNALVYGGESETVMENRRRLMAENNINMIVTKDDLSHLFEMNNALSNGESLSIPGDRMFGSQRHITCSFMGAKAKFPLGPFAIAAQRETPAIAIHVMKEKTHLYHIYIQKIHGEGKNIKERAENLARDYVTGLEKVVNAYPTQWFNYYEFWA